MSDEKTIFRAAKDKENPFVMLDRRLLENRELSWKAKGLLAYLLSRPDNWEVNINDLVKRSTDGEHSSRGAVEELLVAGHLVREIERDANKRFVRWIFQVHEKPVPPEKRTLPKTKPAPVVEPVCENQEVAIPEQPAEPFCGFPQVGFPQVENLPLNNTESNNKDFNDIKNMSAKNALVSEPSKAEIRAARSTSHKLGDPMDGILRYGPEALNPELALSAKIREYPEDVQDILGWICAAQGWATAAVPGTKNGVKANPNYSWWIKELRELREQLDGFGQTAINAASLQAHEITVSHPGALKQTLISVVGRLRKKQTAPESFRPATRLEDGLSAWLSSKGE